MEFFTMTILENVDLQSLNTFGIKVTASRFVTITSEEEAQCIVPVTALQK
jgi:UDP-N-acetylenolpyruvoylglucosamine reductase